MLATGQEVRLPLDVIYGLPRTAEDGDSAAGHSLTLRQQTSRAHELARIVLGKKAERNKESYDLRVAFNKYNVGDIVWLLRETRKVGATFKLEPHYDGPYVITNMPSTINLTIQMDANGQKKTVHHDKLKPYVGKCVPSWLCKVRRKLKTLGVKYNSA